eukprot:m.17392 g.17392  ORF g.17392 m.17392 type:complete len:496 (-) comp7130_c0_seq2:82-1569(-)
MAQVPQLLAGGLRGDLAPAAAAAAAGTEDQGVKRAAEESGDDEDVFMTSEAWIKEEAAACRAFLENVDTLTGPSLLEFLREIPATQAGLKSGQGRRVIFGNALLRFLFKSTEKLPSLAPLAASTPKVVARSPRNTKAEVQSQDTLFSQWTKENPETLLLRVLVRGQLEKQIELISGPSPRKHLSAAPALPGPAAAAAQKLRPFPQFSEGVRARILCISVDTVARALLEKITTLGDKSQRRQTLDDKSARGAIDYWEQLARDFVNNPEWDALALAETARYIEEDDVASQVRVNEIPVPPITARELREAWSSARTQYQTCHSRYCQSGHYPHGLGEGDAAKEFLHNYAQHDMSMYFAFLLYGQSCPPIASRSNPTVVATDIGVSAAAGAALPLAPPATPSVKSSSPAESKSKRSRVVEAQLSSALSSLEAVVQTYHTAESAAARSHTEREIEKTLNFANAFSKLQEILRNLTPDQEHLRAGLQKQCDALLATMSKNA